MTVPLAVSVRPDADPPVIALDGEVDMSNAGRLREALSALTAEHDRVEVDLSQVRYLDSAGINALYDHLDRLSRLVVAPDSVVQRALVIAGLGNLVHELPG